MHSPFGLHFYGHEKGPCGMSTAATTATVAVIETAFPRATRQYRGAHANLPMLADAVVVAGAVDCGCVGTMHGQHVL